MSNNFQSTKAPTRFNILQTDKYVNLMALKIVTSTLIKSPSTNTFAPDGLFSEEIFGKIGSPERMTTLGCIELHCDIIQPEIYNNIISVSSLYNNILNGKVYAVFNEQTNCFEKFIGDPEEDINADTGYSFFMKYLPKLTFEDTGSDTRKANIDLMNKYRDRLTCTKLIVYPAGLRDINQDDTGNFSQDDLNKLYTKVIAYSRSIPENSKSNLYDNLRFNIQTQMHEIYKYFINFLTGKTGFLKAHYGAKAIALGTRNVVTATSFNTRRANDPQLLKPNETKVGIYQTMKGMIPLMKYGVNNYLFTQISYKNPGILTIPLVNPKTLLLENVDISEETKRTFTSPDGVEKLINNFSNVGMRDLPITIDTLTPVKKHYLTLVYDLGKTVYYFRSIQDLEDRLDKVDRSRIRPLTWAEAFYVIAYNLSKDKHLQLTRYPVLGDLSTVMTKIHLGSTNPARVTELKNLMEPTMSGIVFPEYPILGNKYMDTITPSPYKIKGLGMDYDGDTGSVNYSLSDNSNKEIDSYLKSKEYILNVQENFNNSMTDTMNLSLYNLTMD